MLTEEKVIDKIEILDNGVIQLRYVNRIMKDGNEIARSYFRGSLTPGDNIDHLDESTADIVRAAWKNR